MTESCTPRGTVLLVEVLSDDGIDAAGAAEADCALSRVSVAAKPMEELTRRSPLHGNHS